MKKDALIIVRGGGDLATGTIHRLWSAGLRVLVLEKRERPARKILVERRAACSGIGNDTARSHPPSGSPV